MLHNNPADQIYSELPRCSVKQYVALCEDAVFVCSEDGSVMTCNDKARTLLGCDHKLEGTFITNLFSFPYERSLSNKVQEIISALEESSEFSNQIHSDMEYFNDIQNVDKTNRRDIPAAYQHAPVLGVYSGDLPYYKDAYPQIVLCGDAGDEKVCRLRCQLVDEEYGIYIVVVHEIELMWEFTQRQLAQANELKRINKRLHGALTTIVETIHASDIHTLFHESLVNLQKTMDSDGAAIYLAEKDGFHLQESSSMYDLMPIYLPTDSGLPETTLSQGRSTSMHVVSVTDKPGDYQLEKFYVVHPQSGENIEVPNYHMVPYRSFISIPVWYGKHIIALIFVGWTDTVDIDDQDVRLMDSISQYLSVQIMGASRVLRSRHRQNITAAENMFYDRINEYVDIDRETVLFELKRMAKQLDMKLRSITVSQYTGNTMLESERFGVLELPFNIDEIVDMTKKKQGSSQETTPSYRSLNLDGSVMQWVNNNFEPSRIAVIDFGKVFGSELICGLVRTIDQKPFDTLELKLFIRIANFLQNLSKRITSSKTNKQISTALQQGMKNTLQDVPGIIATSLYSSATAEASVGGDFYDLIKLPDNRACVIMGDVSGKGVEAASVSAAVKTALGAYAWTGLNPSEMVRNLNHFLLGFSRFETFVSLFVAIIDMNEKKLTYCSAGHPPTFLYNAKDEVLDLLHIQSGVVGAFEDMRYTDGVVHIDTGDSLYMYTDGVIEARAEDGSFFGERNLRELVLECAKEGIDSVEDKIIEAITTFTNDHLEDDSAVVALEFNFNDERLK